jgi:hypothetical protein
MPYKTNGSALMNRKSSAIGVISRKFNHKTHKTCKTMIYKSKENRMATAQPCVAGKQPVGVLSPTQKTVLRVLSVL